MRINFFTKKSKTVYLQGFWPKSVYLKCFGNQLKTVYLQGPYEALLYIYFVIFNTTSSVKLFEVTVQIFVYNCVFWER